MKKILVYLTMILLGIVVMVITGYFYFDQEDKTVQLIKDSLPFTDSFAFPFILGILGGLVFLRYFYKLAWHCF